MSPIEILKRPDLIGSMAASQKLILGIKIAILGMSIVFFILVLLMITLKIMEKVFYKKESKDSEKEDILDEIGVDLNIKKYAKIDIPENNILDLNIDYTKEKEQIERSIVVNIAANTDIDLLIEQTPREFENNKLNEWLSYKYEHNGNSMVFSPGSDATAESISFLDSNSKEIKFSAIFDLESAKEGEWWKLEADDYNDNIVIEFTVSSSNSSSK